jgi:nitrite reductase/ring-hydroxylating ferredoxin subunit
MREITIDGVNIVICNVDGVFHAMRGTCPHRMAPLAYGALHGHTVVCPWHAWEFDCRTGKLDFNADVRLETYDVNVEAGQIYVRVR